MSDITNSGPSADDDLDPLFRRGPPTGHAPAGIPDLGTPSSGSGEEVAFAYTGRGRDIAGLAVQNALLNIVTLTLYRFWGRTRVRRHILARTEINDEPMAYIGTGWELCKGFLIVLFGLFLPVFLIFTIGPYYLPYGLIWLSILVFEFGFFFLINYAVYASRRYRFSRSTWRGIRFGMDGSAVEYALAAIGFGLLSGATLGWFTPAAQMRLTRRLWEETQYGARRFKAGAPGGRLAAGLYGPFAILWVVGGGAYVGFAVFMSVILPTLDIDPSIPSWTMVLSIYGAALGAGLVIYLASLPYQAALLRRKAEIVGIDAARFRIAATAPGLFGLQVVNGLIVVFTLGFGQPIATARTFRYIFNRLTSTGLIDFDAIRQSASTGPRSGEGLADAFDIGGF
ncbi:MAG: YjgN family protein [Hyphomonadaceae bacterium]